jgi:diguanylate cyclase (GGDEF)-like protein/PAS domain S-box-containing protein
MTASKCSILWASLPISRIASRQLARDDALDRLKKVASRVPGVLYEFRLRPDGSASFPYASDSVSTMYGNRFTPTDIQNDATAALALIHPEDLADVTTSIHTSGRTLAPWQHEFRIKLEDGAVRWLHGNSMPQQEADGSVLWHGFLSDITERKQQESAMAELNRDFESFLEYTTDFVYFKDKDSRFRFASQALARITGHASWRDLIGKNDLDVFASETAKVYQEEEIVIFREGKPLLNRVDPYFDESGNRGWVSTNKWPLLDDDGNILGLFGISRDVTAHKRDEAKLELAASVFNNSREGIMITGTDGTIVDVNDAFSLITGYSREEVVGRNPRILNSGQQTKDYYTAMWQGLIAKGHWYGEVYAEMQTICTVRDAHGKPQHYVSLFSDISIAKAHQQQLEHIAHYDVLTNLPNRSLLADRLTQSMAQAQHRSMKLAVVFLDLDGFKLVNDAYGHEAGDHLLMALASRMKQALRDGDTLARIGGDEFVAVMVDLMDSTESLPILKRLLGAAAGPMPFGDHILQVSASLGVTIYPRDDEIDADQLQRQADQAMYQAKVMGKNRYHFFDAEQDRNVRGHHENLEHIRRAIEANEFVLYYQPKVNMRTGRVVGAEALIRWQHPEQGLLAPGLFLPAIENHPLAVDVGEWVMHTALSQMQVWHEAGLDLPISVNVGARQLQQQDFVARLQSILADHPDIKNACLELEVLETSALEDIARVSSVIEACREMGVTFALDDFGTGYSSLTYLKRLPVTLLKIDQSFVSDMLDDSDNLAILQAAIGLAKAFHRGVLAEGVETVAHGTVLMQMGCDLAQGYGIARPMPADALPAWVASWRPDAAWSAPSDSTA